MSSQILKNSFASIFQKFVIFVNQFALVPIFITFWGVEMYGDWIALTVIPAVFAYTNLGFGTAAATKIIHGYADKNYTKAISNFKAGFICISALIFIIIVISFVLMKVLQYQGVFDNLTIKHEDAFLGVYLVIISGVSGFYNVLFSGLYNAIKKTALSMYLGSGLESVSYTHLTLPTTSRV